jgi:hypothetical protein
MKTVLEGKRMTRSAGADDRSRTLVKKAARRMKRKRRTNGDRQYFQAVLHLRRAQLKEWKLKNNPEKLKKEALQQAAAAARREAKQKERDDARK